MDNQPVFLKVSSSGYDSVDNLVLAPWYTTELSDNVQPPWLVQLNKKSSDHSFRQYDPIAKTIAPYAICYPFLELALGLAFLTSVLPQLTASITVFITGLGAYGIYQTIKKKQITECACLGAVFKLPLSKVSLLENIAMFLMSIFILQSA